MKHFVERQKYVNGGHCLICSKLCPEKTSMDSAGWDWFSGYLRVTVHFCPQHKKGELRDKLLAISQKNPTTWTSEERVFVEKFKLELDRLEAAASRIGKRRRT